MIPAPGGSGDRARILIVDDERANAQLLEAMLAPDGFLLDSASSGEAALAMLAAVRPDLVLVGGMTSGMDGYELVARIKGNRATRNIPVIIVTERDDHAELCVRVRNLLRRTAHGDFHDTYSGRLVGDLDPATADLIASERLYRSAFEAAPVGIGHIGLDGSWLRVNERLCELLGYSRDELLGMNAREFVEPEDVARQRAPFGRMTGGAPDRHVVDEQRFRRRDGTFVWARVNVSPHHDARGDAQHYIAVIDDITERRTLEAQERQSNTMDAIAQLASGVAHDFNNLLTVILGFAELVVADADVARGHGDDLGEIIKAAQRAAGLTKQLLAFSRQQMLHATPLDLNEVITEMAPTLGRLIGEHLEVSLALAPSLPLALVDRRQLEQIVTNLVVNARDAMAGRGKVTIETGCVELENSAFHEEPVIDGHYVMLAITDAGTGMTKETQRRLFEPFYTTKEIGQGTGLGLSTTYGIVRQSNGYVWVYSEPGRGTTFKVYLPLAAGDVSMPALGAAVIAPVPQLVIDERQALTAN
ncbi:MAG: response receiver sensor histidine kinase response regulator [Gemmatimonadetes bacterium]|nr:response receiver sensor histidine kinase response regulator [Gemmatimonadota bacterium]